MSRLVLDQMNHTLRVMSERLIQMENFLHHSHLKEMRELKRIHSQVEDKSTIFTLFNVLGDLKRNNRSTSYRYENLAKTMGSDMRVLNAELVKVNYMLADLHKRKNNDNNE